MSEPTSTQACDGNADGGSDRWTVTVTVKLVRGRERRSKEQIKRKTAVCSWKK